MKLHLLNDPSQCVLCALEGKTGSLLQTTADWLRKTMVWGLM